MNTSDVLISRLAKATDCKLLAGLINQSYRSEFACQGWTNENELIEGLRTNADFLMKIIDAIHSIILVFFDQNEQILTGCVCLQYKPETKTVHLCLFAVRPDLQNKGYGKLILSTAEQYCQRQWDADSIELKVIVQRAELIAYYHRRGYIETGQRQPFNPASASRVKRDDLATCAMRKSLKPTEENN